MSSLNIPERPKDVQWTEDQWKAIYADGRDILISAAAGSGKTAVLVERIIKKITNITNPINIDEILVVTFTDAAAAEMRQRVANALEAAIKAEPESVHLRKQFSLVNRASISTLHSFCQQVIRKYYYLIDLDPGFRVADSVEIQLIRDEIVAELLEREYGKEDNELFLNIIDTFTRDRSDTELEEIILKLYDFSRSTPNPEKWLQNIMKMYTVDDDTKIADLSFINIIYNHIKLQLQGAKDLTEQLLQIARMPGGPEPRVETYTDDLQKINSVLNMDKPSWEQLKTAIVNMKFVTAKRCSGSDFDEDLLKQANKIRDDVKNIFKNLTGKIFARPDSVIIEDISEMGTYVEGLIQLVNKFADDFSSYKKEEGLADFSDLEHYCLAILTKDGSDEASLEASLHYKNLFKEVLVDEYQDTNMVQEAIIQHVTKDSECRGNLFMVGDVKQSIYRFRLAEPNLFLSKYNRFDNEGANNGLRIDLAKNFRSRPEVLDGTNYIFKQIMGVNVGEINYDERAELKLGAGYNEEQFPVEVSLIDLANDSDLVSNDNNSDINDEEFDYEDLEKSQLEGKHIAEQINKIIKTELPIFDLKTKTTRPAMYKDIVILLRSMQWAPEIMAQLRELGIPVYAELSSGYFSATEVKIMMSLLKIIDNPFQDIPLAAVLRSPLVNLTETELVKIRLCNKNGTFYESLSSFLKTESRSADKQLYDKASLFYEQLQGWRTLSRKTSLSKLIWHLYEETHFYDFVGGLPGGAQRQANLTALYDRARQYESTSFRGLFRFLRFIERMSERGDDLGTARAIGEQEDVVRIMTIHKSKGLEFPIVFAAGLNREFNMNDLKGRYFIDKDLGFATNYINAEKQLEYDSLQKFAFIEKKRLELIAEEMRVLYVALTRAKEKLYLVGTVNNLSKNIESWQSVLANRNWLISDFERLKCKNYLDWIGRSLIRHHKSDLLKTINNGSEVPSEIAKNNSNWVINIIPSNTLAIKVADEKIKETGHYLDVIKNKAEVAVNSSYKEEVHRRLSWEYENKTATIVKSKQSVSELKRLNDTKDLTSDTKLISSPQQTLANRPQFMQEKKIMPAERGTIMHTVMQHVPLGNSVNEISVTSLIDKLIVKEILTVEQSEAININDVVAFFESELGKRLLNSSEIRREVPFSMTVSAAEVYNDESLSGERILIQGIIDCIFIDDDGVVLLDYKTDRINGVFQGGFENAKQILHERYRIQIDLYTRALESILNKRVTERYLYFFDGGHLLRM